MLLLGAVTAAQAQNVAHTTQNGLLKSKVPANIVVDNKIGKPVAGPVAKRSTPTKPSVFKDAINMAPIGTSNYDLQTNGSMARRIIRYPDGKISAVWTMSQANDPYNDRGSGYNHFDGTAWGDEPTKRIEKQRCGFTTLTTNSSNQELVIVHAAEATATSGFKTLINKNTGPGNRTWTSTTPIANNNGVGGLDNIWHKTASSGNNIYVINTPQSGAPKEPTEIAGAVYFSRSTDGGATFSNFALLPEEDTITYKAALGGADRYTIDAFDKYVVIGAAGQYSDIAIWKSEDFGATFTRTKVESFAIPNYDGLITDIDGDAVADTVSAHDLSMDVILDKDGKAHLFYGRVQYYNGGADTNGLQIFFPEKSIMHWNEATGTITAIAGALNTDGQPGITTGSAFNPDYARIGLSGQPTSGIDDAGNLYLAYISVVEGDTTNADLSEVSGQQFHNIFAIASSDKGLSWSDPVSLTYEEGGYKENVFPSMARYVDQNIHLVWQQDIEPGTALQNDDPQGENIILYSAWRASMIRGVKNQNGILSDVSLVAYPNPTNGIIRFNVTAAKAATASKVIVTDMMGKLVKVVEASNIEAGNNTIETDLSNLSNGIYFYSLETKEGKTATQKLVVTR